MNFYNPYFYSLPANTGLLRNIIPRGLSLGSIVNGTQKTLNIINQAIPIIKEASPMMKNAKTMFKIANEFKKEDVKEIEIKEEKKEINGPNFFI